MTQDKQPSGSGNTLRDWRIKQVELAIIELKQHTRTLEDTLLEMRTQSQASGMSFKWQIAVLGAILTTISGLVYALLTLPK